MLTISEAQGQLSIYTPSWIGALLLILAAVLAAYVVRGARMKAKLNPRIVGAGVGALALAWVGWTFLASSVTLQRVGVIVAGPLGEEIRAPWSLVRSLETDERPSARAGGRGKFLVLGVEGGDEVEIPLSGLSAEETVKVMDFVKARVKRH